VLLHLHQGRGVRLLLLASPAYGGQGDRQGGLGSRANPAMTPRKPFFRPHLVSDRAPDAGDDQAARFRALILPHMDGAYNFARYLTRDATAAEDIAQEAFLRAFRAF